jgi:hypothetical protein
MIIVGCDYHPRASNKVHCRFVYAFRSCPPSILATNAQCWDTPFVVMSMWEGVQIGLETTWRENCAGWGTGHQHTPEPWNDPGCCHNEGTNRGQ